MYLSEMTADLITICITCSIMLKQTGTCHQHVLPECRTYTYRRHLAVNNRVIRAARVTRRKIRSTVGATDWTKFVPITVAGSLACRLEAGDSVEMFIHGLMLIRPEIVISRT